MKVRLTIADALLIGAVVAGIAGSYVLAKSNAEPGGTVLVQVDGSIVHKTSLAEPHQFRISGARGELALEIRDGTIAVVEADCPNKICVKTGRRHRVGEVIVCVPNKTIIRIEGVEGSVKATTG